MGITSFGTQCYVRGIFPEGFLPFPSPRTLTGSMTPSFTRAKVSQWSMDLLWFKTEERTTSALDSLVLLQTWKSDCANSKVCFAQPPFIPETLHGLKFGCSCSPLLHFYQLSNPFSSISPFLSVFCVISSFLWPLLIFPNSPIFI